MLLTVPDGTTGIGAVTPRSCAEGYATNKLGATSPSDCVSLAAIDFDALVSYCYCTLLSEAASNDTCDSISCVALFHCSCDVMCCGS